MTITEFTPEENRHTKKLSVTFCFKNICEPEDFDLAIEKILEVKERHRKLLEALRS